MMIKPTRAIKIFYCYAPEDDALREELARHLSPLRRLKYITAWFDRDIQAGTDREYEIETYLDTASIILLLVSADFIYSDYCYGVEMQRSLERHKAGTACVIPIILRPVNWEETPIGELQALPKGKKPVTQWANRDEAWLDIVQGIREVVRTLLPKQILSSQETSILYPVQMDQQIQLSAGLPPLLPPLTSSPISRQDGQPLTQNAIHKLTPQQPFAGDIQRKSSHLNKTDLSRRTVIVGLVGLSAAGGGLTWLMSSRQSPRQSSPASSKVAIRKPLYTYRGDNQPIFCVSWSPTGERIASTGIDKTIRVWDAVDGTNLYTCTGHTDAVYYVAWSPDGYRIASGGADNTVRVWDANNGNQLFVYPQHTNFVECVAWSPDGTRLASASRDKTVQVWNPTDGGDRFMYTGHKGEVYTVAWSSNDGLLASAGADKTVQVWHDVNGKNVYTYRAHRNVIQSVAWSPDDKRIASASKDQTVQVWGASDGSYSYTYRGHTDIVYAAAWSPGGQQIASASFDKTVQLWDAILRKHVYTYQGHTDIVYSVVWSPNGKQIVSASRDGTARLWSTE